MLNSQPPPSTNNISTHAGALRAKERPGRREETVPELRGFPGPTRITGAATDQLLVGSREADMPRRKQQAPRRASGKKPRLQLAFSSISLSPSSLSFIQLSFVDICVIPFTHVVRRLHIVCCGRERRDSAFYHQNFNLVFDETFSTISDILNPL